MLILEGIGLSGDIVNYYCLLLYAWDIVFDLLHFGGCV